MAKTAQGTIEAAIDRYVAGKPDEVLREFHTNARIVGTKRSDRWDQKSRARAQLGRDMDTFAVGGAFVTRPVAGSELKRLGPGVLLFHRVGPVIFTRKDSGKKSRVQGRWTVILKQYADGWKINHSHFSLDEGDGIF